MGEFTVANWIRRKKWRKWSRGEGANKYTYRGGEGNFLRNEILVL